jgi:hypothetical protein
MERGAWTGERLDALADSMRGGFDRVDADVRDARSEIRETRVELKGEIQELRQTVLRVGGGLIGSMALGFLSVFAAILVRGG